MHLYKYSHRVHCAEGEGKCGRKDGEGGMKVEFVVKYSVHIL